MSSNFPGPFFFLRGACLDQSNFVRAWAACVDFAFILFVFTLSAAEHYGHKPEHTYGSAIIFQYWINKKTNEIKEERATKIKNEKSS